MNWSKIAGSGLLVLAAAIITGIVIKEQGLKEALIIFGAALGFSAMIIGGVVLLLKD